MCCNKCEKVKKHYSILNRKVETAYTEIINDSKRIRTFSINVNELDLQWHFDEDDREFSVEQGENWLFQIDNQLPIELIKNEKYSVPKGVYHRIIKNNPNKDLIIIIH